MLNRILLYIPGIAFPMLINFVLTILNAQFLSPGEYGILNVYLNSIQILYALTCSIFQNSSLRFYSLKKEYGTENEYVTTYLVGNVLSTILLIPILLICHIFLKYDIWILLLSVGFNGLFQFICNLYRVRRETPKYNFIRCVAAFFSVISLVVFFKVIKPLSYYWPIISVYGSYGIISLMFLIKHRNEISFKYYSKSLLKNSIIYGLPLIGVSVLGYIVATCDQYFILYYLGDVAVGNYSLGHRLVDAVVINLLMMILLVMTPELNRVHDEKGYHESSKILTKMINASVWIIMPISFAIIIYSEYIIDFVFPKYTNASHIMQLVVFASMFHGLSMFTCKGLELEKNTKFIFLALLISTAINCVYNVIFIPIYGLDASAHSSLLAYITYNYLLYVYSRKYYQIIFDPSFLARTSLVTAATVLAAVLLLKSFAITTFVGLLFQILICGAVYISLSCLVRLHKVFV